MPTWLKVTLIVFAAIVAGFGALGAGGYYWWKYNGQAMIDDAKAAIAEATKFGSSHDRQGCVDEAVSRVKDAGFTGAITVRLFLQGCLKVAKPVAGFCDGVPAKSEIIKTATWQVRINARYGLKSPFESSVLAAIQDVCDPDAGK